MSSDKEFFDSIIGDYLLDRLNDAIENMQALATGIQERQRQPSRIGRAGISFFI